MHDTSVAQPELDRSGSPLTVSSNSAAVPTQVCRLDGEPDRSTRCLLRAALAEAVADVPAMLVVELSGLTGCDSACLNALLDAHHAAEAAGTWLVLSGAGPQLLHLLAITGTDEVFTVRAHVRTSAPQLPVR
ncbi:hypothetical protein CFP65_0414 [Kitasatospora sp. MMS16-BH015]|uniref:STAS domain-containing protein n=1 Tax=Kitasatospora sp. MMS16-BH015 TaxID=2018025 RepID=UPI000CA34AD7|nr:STAS domain-containing protein [Kitasatospora sp. MMS16-BH015]AUG75380.1 hypothetical protein CFP65_0414 [Kitasatospora sp. MMS16-BH015]